MCCKIASHSAIGDSDIVLHTAPSSVVKAGTEALSGEFDCDMMR